MELLARGGPLVWPILGCSVLGRAIFPERLVRIPVPGARQATATEEVLTALRDGKLDEARGLASRSDSAEGRLLLQALEVHGRGREIFDTVIAHNLDKELPARLRDRDFPRCRPRAEPLPEVELPTVNRPVPIHGGPKDKIAGPPIPDQRPRSLIRAIPKVVRHGDLPPKPRPVPSPTPAVQKEYKAGPGTAPQTTEEGRVAGSSDGGAKLELQAGSGGETDVTTDAMSEYLAGIVRKIERHKRYPLPARQKRLEGRTSIRFLLRAAGAVPLEIVLVFRLR